MAEKLILLVEDTAADEELVLVSLQNCPAAHRVFVVRDGAEAIEYLLGTGKHAGRDPHAIPAVVLLDLKLPKIDGFEVLKRVRAEERTRLLPVVVLTSSKEEEDVTRCMSLGANSYVSKPVDFEHFSEAVQLIGRYWLQINQPLPVRS